MDDELLKTSEVCTMLRISRATVSRMVHDGRLQPTYAPLHGWRFRRSQIEKMMKGDDKHA